MNEIIKSMGSLALKKDTPKELANQLNNSIDHGTTDSHAIFVRADCLMKTMDELKKLNKEGTIDEIATNSFTEYKGVKLETAEFGTKYDYSNNPIWIELKAQEDAIAVKRKEVEAFIKTLSKHTGVVDPETGETREFWPAIKTSTTAPKLTYPKS